MTPEQHTYHSRLKNLIVAVRESPSPELFDMGEYFHSCGTPACVLGHYAARIDLQDAFRFGRRMPNLLWSKPWVLAQDEKGRWEGIEGIDDARVCDHFGITDTQARELFSMRGCGQAQKPEEAIAYLERFIRELYPEAYATNVVKLPVKVRERVPECVPA